MFLVCVVVKYETIVKDTANSVPTSDAQMLKNGFFNCTPLEENKTKQKIRKLLFQKHSCCRRHDRMGQHEFAESQFPTILPVQKVDMKLTPEWISL